MLVLVKLKGSLEAEAIVKDGPYNFVDLELVIFC